VATAPRARDPGVDEAFRALPRSYAATARALRAVVRAEAPLLRETVKWNNPFWVGRRDVLCLQCFDEHVNLGVMRGAELARAHPALEGTGKSMRHVKVLSPSAARSRKVIAVVRAAAQLDSRGD
jgi:hypothetical protein